MNPSQKQAIEAKAEELYPLGERNVNVKYRSTYEGFIEGATFGLSLKKIHMNELRPILRRYEANEITLSMFAELLNEL